MANSVDPDQTAPIGVVCSGSTLFASILNSSVMLGNYLQQTTSADDIFRCIFFLALQGLIVCGTDFYAIMFFQIKLGPRADCSLKTRYGAVWGLSHKPSLNFNCQLHCSHSTTAIWVSSPTPVIQ